MPRTQRPIAISITPDLLQLAKQRAKDLGFENSFSAYVKWLITEDLKPESPGRDGQSKKEGKVSGLPVTNSSSSAVSSGATRKTKQKKKAA